MRTRPVILHLDLDAFFSAVEQLHKPSLRGKPVIVGGTGRRGVVSTASYEARVFGIGSAMSIGEARRRAPNAAYLAPRFAAYRDASMLVMGLLAELSPLIEQVSIDEAYVDLTPTHPEVDVPGVSALAERLKTRVTEVTGLTASIGVGTSKLLSKIGSELNKPNGLTVIAPGDEVATLAPMPIRKLPGVGPATQERLHRRGLHTIGEVAAVPLADLISILGQAHGTSVHQHANGIDDRELEPDREAKSVSAETTFPTDLTGHAELVEHARRLINRVIERLAKDGTSGRTVTLKIRSYDFSTITRSLTLDQPTDSAAKILAAAKQLLEVIDTSNGIRLLGVGVSGLSDYAQQDLLADLDALAEVDAAAAQQAVTAGPGPGEQKYGQSRDGRSNAQSRDGRSRDERIRDKQTRDEQSRNEQTRDGQSQDEQSQDEQSQDEQSQDEQSQDEQSQDEQNQDEQNEDGQNRDAQSQDGQRQVAQSRDEQSRDAQNPDEPTSGDQRQDEQVSVEPPPAQPVPLDQPLLHSPAGDSVPESADPSTAAPIALRGVWDVPVWIPGQDVMHAERGPGWVQGAGLGRVTVRFEGPHTGPGPIATYAITDPLLTPADPPVW